MDKAGLKAWHNLTDLTKRNIFRETSAATGLPEAAIEKDWWVVRTIDLVFSSSIASSTVFKGGTSLSKAWGLIDRFSEDIDLALDRRFLGFDKATRNMTGSQVRRLRERSHQFISEKYFPELKEKFAESGFNNVTVNLIPTTSQDQDPLIIEIFYPMVSDKIPYLQPRVLIEIGSRSLMEPFKKRSFSSFIGVQYYDQPFADVPVTIPTVRPERTFLEKIFLLHEEFQQTTDKIRVERKSRHMYDLEKLMDTDFARSALTDQDLYRTIVEHRRIITPLRGINYANHDPENIRLIPPPSVLAEWEKDYHSMAESMISKPSLNFHDLLKRLEELNKRINRIRKRQ
ncbi:MAG: nucleotidyl transferase AbiEii/AbiGii toxin family protein [Bacteroidetes bacterium]|nr:nucleotidyl transferase AbiEii/AbiGii toxin family protein [Bacteroidota bacterium]